MSNFGYKGYNIYIYTALDRGTLLIKVDSTIQCGPVVIIQLATFIINSSENRKKTFVFTHRFVLLILTPLSFMSQIKELDLLFKTVFLVYLYVPYKVDRAHLNTMKK